MKIQQRIEKTKELYFKYERYILPAAFLGGFIWDNFTLRRVDLLYENLFLIWNLFLVGASIVVLNAYETGHLRFRITDRLIRFVPLIMQFSFGGLFSAFFVFYARSASLFASWPFLLFLAALLIGNEFFKKKYLNLTFQLSLYCIVIISYAAFAVPVVLGTMGALIFIVSGFVALTAIGFFIFILFKIAPQRIRQNKHALILSIGMIYGMFQIAYFTNVLPPIPLALKESGIYHSIERINENGYIYKVSFEPAPWYLPLKEASGTLHVTPGESIYSYSAVFAPTRFNNPIFHRWMFFDETKDEWIQQSKIRFQIAGGREGGYRGYTFKPNLREGKWRVDVVTERNQVLGRRTFRVIKVDIPPKLDSILR